MIIILYLTAIDEHEIYATIDYECRIRGANYLAYPPVIAGGSRANIIHYINNNQIVRENETVLMDAGNCSSNALIGSQVA